MKGIVFSLLAVAGGLATAPLYAADKMVTSFGFDMPSQYFFRGIAQENQGIIFQPWVEITADLYDGSAQKIDDLTLTATMWNSLHSGPTGHKLAKGPARGWYESDVYLTLAMGIASYIDLSATRAAYMSPNGAFKSVEEISFTVKLDDRRWLGEQALYPSMTLAFETRGQVDASHHEGNYLELGVEPRIPLPDASFWATRPHLKPELKLPATLGMSLGSYYENASGDDKAFGFLDIGAEVSLALDHWVSADYGEWRAAATLHLLFLGSTPKAINGGDVSELIAGLNFSIRF